MRLCLLRALGPVRGRIRNECSVGAAFGCTGAGFGPRGAGFGPTGAGFGHTEIVFAGMVLLRDDRKTWGNTQKICKNPENPDFWIFRKVLRPRRHPRGFPELVGCILYEYQPERSHMDLVRIHFHDFPPKSGILQPAQPIYLLHRDYKSAE